MAAPPTSTSTPQQQPPADPAHPQQAAPMDYADTAPPSGSPTPHPVGQRDLGYTAGYQRAFNTEYAHAISMERQLYPFEADTSLLASAWTPTPQQQHVQADHSLGTPYVQSFRDFDYNTFYLVWNPDVEWCNDRNIDIPPEGLFQWLAAISPIPRHPPDSSWLCITGNRHMDRNEGHEPRVLMGARPVYFSLLQCATAPGAARGEGTCVLRVQDRTRDQGRYLACHMRHHKGQLDMATFAVHTHVHHNGDALWSRELVEGGPGCIFRKVDASGNDPFQGVPFALTVARPTPDMLATRHGASALFQLAIRPLPCSVTSHGGFVFHLQPVA